MSQAERISAALGGARRSGAWWRCRCPVHDSRGSTLTLRDGDRGLIAVCHAGCDRTDIIAALREHGLLDGHNDHRRRYQATAHRGSDGDDAARRAAVAQRIWESAQNARRTAVAAYLAARGITLPVPASLRWAPSLRRLDGTSGPAMVARVDNIDGELIGTSRTWLCRDIGGIWRRRDRAMLGRARGGAVRLAPAAETLMVGEGIETCLAAIQATGMPAWAALSTSGMASLVLPLSTRTVLILADHDANGAGERAARAAAERWLAEGRCVRIAMPPKPCTDMADVLAGRAYAEVQDAA